MKTAFITNFCPFYRRRLFHILAQKCGATFFFFSDTQVKKWEQNNPHGDDSLPAFDLHADRSSRISVLFRLAHHLLTHNYDCYIQGISGRFIVPLTYLIARIRGVPFVIWTGFWEHPRTLFHRITYPLVRHIYRHADALVAYGTHVKDYLHYTCNVPEEKIFVAWNTADNALYNMPVTQQEKESLRRELGAQNSPLLLSVGRLEEEKGHDVLIHAAHICHARGLTPTVCIIGTGPHKNALQSLADTCPDVPVIFCDYVPNDALYRYYAAADITIVPSRTTRSFKEPWGLVINEAMNQGCPVIASDAVGAARGGLLEDEETGYVVPENDADSLAHAIMHLMAHTSLREQMSRNARTCIAGWTYPRMAQGFLDAVHYACTHRSATQ